MDGWMNGQMDRLMDVHVYTMYRCMCMYIRMCVCAVMNGQMDKLVHVHVCNISI